MQLPQFKVTAASRTPAWQLTINDRDVTAELSNRIISLTLTDNRGFEADTVDITIDDSDGKMAIPDRGAKLSLKLGWQGAPLVDKGEYIVDTIEHSGAPDKLTLAAKSADFRDSLLNKKSISYPPQTLGSLVATIAAAHGLSSRVAPTLSGVAITQKIQSNESDANLLTRLAGEHDAMAGIKNGAIIFIAKGNGKNAGGTDLASITVTRQNGDRHSYRRSERDKFTGVKAYWYDIRKGKKRWVTAGTKDKTTALKKAYPNQAAAMAAAQAELKRLQRGVATFSMSLAFAMPHLFPETPIKAEGFKPVIDAIEWITVRAIHELGDNGFITNVECEMKT